MSDFKTKQLTSELPYKMVDRKTVTCPIHVVDICYSNKDYFKFVPSISAYHPSLRKLFICHIKFLPINFCNQYLFLLNIYYHENLFCVSSNIRRQHILTTFCKRKH